MMKAGMFMTVLLLGAAFLPPTSAAETITLEGPHGTVVSLDASCSTRDEAGGPGDDEREKRPIWINCTAEGKRITLIRTQLARRLNNANDFQSHKADNLFDDATLGTEWYPLRDRLWLFGGMSQGGSDGGFLTMPGWICPDAKKRCGKPERAFNLKVVANRSATVALLAIGDFETTELKAADGKVVGIKRELPAPVRAMISSFDFQK